MSSISAQNFQFHLAPMEGISEWPFRVWLALFGGFSEATTPFLRVTETFPQSTHPEDFWPDRELDLYKLHPQLMASDPKRFSVVARSFLQLTDFVELNCGCPAPTVFKHGAGSQLLREARKFRSFVQYICNEIGAEHLALKIRLGLERPSEAFALLDELGDLRLHKLTIHARTKTQGYSGAANWGIIHYASTKLPIPLVGSGDVTDHHSLESVRRSAPHVKTLLIGRGSLQKPWIFQELQGSTPINPHPQALVHALKVFYLLHYAKINRPDIPCLSFRNLHFNIGIQDQPWAENLQLMEHSVGITKPTSIYPECRRSLGRLKMIWNLMRPNDPTRALTTRNMLRSAKPQEFFQQLEYFLHQ